MAEKKKSKVGMIIGIIVGILLLIALGCAGCTFFVMNKASEGITEVINANPVVEKHVGRVDEVSLFGAIKDTAESGGQNGMLTYELDGTKGKGTLVALITGENENAIIVKGTLTMADGTVYDVVTGKLATDMPGHEGHDHGPGGDHDHSEDGK